MNRRRFLQFSAATGLYTGVVGWADSVSPCAVSVRNAEPAPLVRKAVELLGGIRKFVRPGQTVLIKPNIGWDRVPEQAATTNPDAVAEVVQLCRKAGLESCSVVGDYLWILI